MFQFWSILVEDQKEDKLHTQCFYLSTTPFSGHQFSAISPSKIQWGLVVITRADHLVFERVWPVKQSIHVLYVQSRWAVQGLNYMVEIKKLHFKSFSRLGSYGVQLSTEVMMQHHTTVLEESRHVASAETCPVGRTSSVPGDGFYMSSSAFAVTLPCFCHKFWTTNLL